MTTRTFERRRALGLHRTLVTVLFVLGCTSERTPAPARRADEAPAPATRAARPTAEACLADRVGKLAPGWTERDDCTLENQACLPDCARGDASACFVQALIYEETGRDADARQMFERACLAGLSLGCVNYGAMRWRSTSEADMTCARRLFAKSCDAADSMGCMMVARMMVEDSKPPDLDGAKALLERTCDVMKGPPCRMLAAYLELGDLGAPPDTSRSKALLQRACEGLDPSACGDPPSAVSTFRD